MKLSSPRKTHKSLSCGWLSKVGRHLPQRLVRKFVALGDSLGVLIQHVRPAHAVQHLNGKNFLDALRELHKADNLAAAGIDGPYAAGAIRFGPFGDCDAAEDGGLPHL